MQFRGIGRTMMVPAAVLVVVLCCSCGPKGLPLYPVSGLVYCDGQPAEGAVVVFHPVGDSGELVVLRPSGLVQADGSFVLGSHEPKVLGSAKPRDGAPAGEYQVTIQWLRPDFYENPYLYADSRKNPDKLGTRYANPKTSGLRAEVKEGSNKLPPFQLLKK